MQWLKNLFGGRSAPKSKSKNKDKRKSVSNATKRDARKALLKYKREGVTHVKTLTCNDSHVCSECRKLSGRVIPIDKALSQMPIPHVCTSEMGCRCWYTAAKVGESLT